GAGFGDGLVLLTHSSTHADASDYLVALLQRDTAGKDHHAAMVRDMNTEELIARLAEPGKILGRNVECPGSPSLIDRYIDAADPGLIHADVRHQVAAAIHDSDIHRLADFLRLLFSGGNDSSCICERYHETS